MAGAKRIVVVGGGITGLAAAHAAIAIARAKGTAVSVTLLETSPRFGGNLVSERRDGFLLDAGPDSWVSSKPHATALARELGLGSSLLGTNEATRRYYVAHGGRLHAVPEGLVLGVPTRLAPLARTELFSWRGKVRMAMEPFVVRRRFEGDDDESIAQFATRRLGREASDRLVAPLLGGIFAGDASEVSVRAAFPQLVAMEAEHGSLVRGMQAMARRRKAASAAAGEGSAFTSLEGGVGALVDALVARLQADGATLRANAGAGAIVRAGERAWAVELSSGGGDRIEADEVLLAVPAHVSARWLGAVDEPIERVLSRIPYASATTVFLAYRRADVAHPLDGVGFVVPRSLGRPIVASTWVSSKWRGRAPEGHVLLRVFFLGSLDRDDEWLARAARDELRSLMKLEAEPIWSRVFRFDRSSAQLRVGHLATMRDLRERLARFPGLRVAGGGYDGIGIPDCIRQGQDAARAMVG